MNAKNATDLTSVAYTAQMQTYRDLLEMSWKTGDNEKTRATEIAKATIQANASANAASSAADANAIGKIGGAITSVLASDGFWKWLTTP